MENKRKSGVEVVVQMAADGVSSADVPTQSDFQHWTDYVAADSERCELCVRIVGNEESKRLNHRYRGRHIPTNVLSFPCDVPSLPVDEVMPLGDIVLAAPLVLSEAHEQGKSAQGHWAHLFIHGMLHLQGYDHADEEGTRRMQSREIEVLQQLGFANPYQLCDE